MLRSTLKYNKDTGVFTYLQNVGNKRVGDIAGSVRKDGYIAIKIQGKAYKAHRLAWVYEYGDISKTNHIDHINHDRGDNRIGNLRLTIQRVNGKNRSKSIANTSGVTGVYWRKDSKQWRALIYVDGVNINLGNFVEFHEAVNARKNAEILYGFHENHGEEQVNDYRVKK